MILSFLSLETLWNFNSYLQCVISILANPLKTFGWDFRMIFSLVPVREARSWKTVIFYPTRCPCCFILEPVVLWLDCVSEPSVHDLSLQTLGSSIMCRGASLFKIKRENISLPTPLFICFFVFSFSSYTFYSCLLLSVCLSLSFCLR